MTGGGPSSGGSVNPGGGAPSGGTGNPGAGAPSGGTAGTGGGAAPTGGSGGSSGAGTGTEPPGYWKWGNWHGCSWTGKGTLGATTIMPQDFTTKPASEAYCVSGTVGAEPEYKSVALLGFNVNEAPPASCGYKPVDMTAPGLPSVVPTGNGLAVNFVKKGTDTAFTLRVQIQGPNGHKPDPEGATDRWCATIKEVQGKVFIPYSEFTPSCWETDVAKRGTPYSPTKPISAVVFSVPGKLTDTPFNFCVNGFAYGSAATDAPDGTATAGDQVGMVGGPGSRDLDFARAKVQIDGEQYIIQNNNWGNPEGTDLLLSYKNNSFKITSGTGTGQSAPASFPSIYIGNNGNTANGVYSTSTTDNMPIQISAIKDIATSFRYSGTTSVFNAAYDVWFSRNNPPPAGYRDGVSGFVMVWLRDPTGKQPIGSKQATVQVGGEDWDVWVGPRGPGPDPNGNQNAPVVSFVNPRENDDSRAQTFVNKNLKLFIDAAKAHGIDDALYLTDVFAGFEIWEGGAGGNLGVDEFKCVVNK